MSIEWAEDDGLPSGVVRVDCEGPKDGKTYVMYHGTTRANARSIRASGFRQSSNGMLGRGVYLSRDLKKASRYPMKHPEHDRVVVKVKVHVGKVITINRKNHPLQKTWHDHGYDTAWVPPKCGMVSSGLEEDCVWDSKRITILETIEPKPVRDTGAGRKGFTISEFIGALKTLEEEEGICWRAAGYQFLGCSPGPFWNSRACRACCREDCPSLK